MGLEIAQEKLPVGSGQCGFQILCSHWHVVSGPAFADSFFPGILIHICPMRMISVQKIGTQITKYLDWCAHACSIQSPHPRDSGNISLSSYRQKEYALFSWPFWVPCFWVIFGSQGRRVFVVLDSYLAPFARFCVERLLDVLGSPEGLSSISFEDKNVCYLEQKQWPPLHECGVSSTMSGAL